MAHGTMAEEMY